MRTCVCVFVCVSSAGKAVFNYDFNSLTTDSPLIQAVYTALKETETRATDLLPYWKVRGCTYTHTHTHGHTQRH